MFRSLVIPLHLIANMSPTRIVFLTPLYFGIAHVHHFYEFTLTHPEFPLLPAILRTVVQFAYTSLFGFFASFVFLRTGSLYAVIIAHMFCNWQGLPRIWGRVGANASRKPTGPSDAKKKDAKDERGAAAGDMTTRRDRSTIYTAGYYLLLFVGAYGFKQALWPLTETAAPLADFGAAK
jgi:prenyl protein peptidase